MPEDAFWKTYRGIVPPQYTQVPDVIFDQLLPRLGHGELKVLLVIVRKTFGWRKVSEAISFAQLVKSTGLSKPAVRQAVKDLEAKGVIWVHRGDSPAGDATVNSYGLVLASETPPEAPPEKGGGREVTSLPWGSNFPTHIGLETLSQETNEYESSSSFAANAGERWGRNDRDRKALAKSLSKYPPEAVQWAVELLEQRNGEIDNPAAWLNAVTPRLVEQLAERQREELTARQEALLPVQAMAAVYRGTGDSEAQVKRQLLSDFGDADLVEAALAATGAPETRRESPGGG